MRAFREGPKRGPGYEWPCWFCGEIGMIGVDGFGNKNGTVIRPRNMAHQECWDALPIEEIRLYRYRDTKHILRRMQRHKSKRSLDREALRRRRAGE